MDKGAQSSPHVEVTMYRIERKDNGVTISDWKGQIIFSVSGDCYVVYNSPAGELTTKKVSDLDNPSLLMALARAVKLSLQE